MKNTNLWHTIQMHVFSARVHNKKYRFGLLISFFVCVLAGSGSSMVQAHDWEDVRLVLLTWANGLSTSNRSVIDQVLHPEYPNREAYFEMVERAWPGNRYVDDRFARFFITGDTARVERVVLIEDRGTFKEPLTINLVRREGRWQIRSIALEPELPAELAARPFPEHDIL